MASRKRKTGGSARFKTLHVVGNPDGNRMERRVAAKIARMAPERAAALPLAEQTTAERWTDYSTKGR